MELLTSPEFYYLIQNKSVLQCSRLTGKLKILQGSSLPEGCVCLGCFDGFVGKLPGSTSSQSDSLLLITRTRLAGKHPLTGDAILAVEQVQSLPLNQGSPFTLNLSPCSSHANQTSNNINSGIDFLQKGSKKLLKGTTNSIKLMGDQVGNPLNRIGIKSPSTPSKLIVSEETVQDAGRSLEEVLRLFNETTNFYFCHETDATLNIQALLQSKLDSSDKNRELLHDNHFFWNKHLLAEVPLDSVWSTRIIQGFVQQREVPLDPILALNNHKSLILTLISKRSVFRAGTRYMRRGIDDQGNCANFVETEQILNVFGHCVSVLMLRGSIPLFWNQSGLKYHPMPRFERSRVENLEALNKHFNNLTESYGEPVTVINLVDQTGRELPLAESFLDYMLECKKSRVHYVSFDFHDHCRGLRLDHVDVLIKAMDSDLRDMKFTWVDKQLNVICKQVGVMRINCMDCLDRTNVVQMGLGRTALEMQLMKLGLLPPDQSIPQDLTILLQLLWADNGDAISKQYAGTAALKGDFTRSGQRNIYGLVKDGYNSASRYYLNHIRDASRQGAIDFMLGYSCAIPATPVLKDKEETDVEYDEKIHEELRLLVQECQRFFLPEGETLLAAWALIDADAATGADLSSSDMDRTVMLTRTSVYVAEYDEDLDKFIDCTCINLQSISRIEIGPLSIPSSFQNAFKAMSKNKPATGPTCLRIYYTPTSNIQQNDVQKCDGCSPYFYTWRAGDTRLFNNVAIPLRSQEEADEYVRAIGEQFHVAMQVADIKSFSEIRRLAKMDRKRSRSTQNESSQGNKFTGLFTGFSRKIAAGTANINPLKLRNGAEEFEGAVREPSPPGLVFNPINCLKSDEHLHVDNTGIIFGSRKKDSNEILESARKSVSLTCLIDENIRSEDPPNPTQPLFVLPPDSASPTPPLGCDPNTRSSTCLNTITHTNGLAPPSTQMRQCQSEGVIKNLLGNQDDKPLNDGTLSSHGPESKNNKFMGRLASGGGKLLGITSLSFSKLSGQVQALRSPREPQLPKKFQARANVFQAYKERIMSSQTKITLL